MKIKKIRKTVRRKIRIQNKNSRKLHPKKVLLTHKINFVTRKLIACGFKAIFEKLLSDTNLRKAIQIWMYKQRFVSHLYKLCDILSKLAILSQYH